jgi:hypothetical protein
MNVLCKLVASHRKACGTANEAVERKIRQLPHSFEIVDRQYTAWTASILNHESAGLAADFVGDGEGDEIGADKVEFA